MAEKSWHLKRRSFLKGAAGVALSLPFLDCMAKDVKAKHAGKAPRRFASIYLPYGVCMQKNEWGWYPSDTGKNYTFTQPLMPLKPLKDDMTVISGMSHKSGWTMGGHDTADIFLTAGFIKGNKINNSISIDQVYAHAVGTQTRFRSLVISTVAGVGKVGRTFTLSYNRMGAPIPAQNHPKLIFDRLFGKVTVAEKSNLYNSSSMLDTVLEHARSTRHRLGKSDLAKFDEYLSTVRDTEKQIQRSQQWLDKPKAKIDENAVDLTINEKNPREFYRLLYDLIFLSFQTDSTRAATCLLGPMITSAMETVPKILGISTRTHHDLAHKDTIEHGKYNQFHSNELAYFLNRLKSTQEGETSLLDNTIVLYGSSNSKTHNNRNYPLVLAGGKEMGLRHGQHLKMPGNTPLTNLFVTTLNRLNVPAKSFMDSTGELTEIL